MSGAKLLSLRNLSVWYTVNHPYFQGFPWIWGQMKLLA